MKSVILVFAALLYIICLPLYFLGIHDARISHFEQTFAGVTTGAGVYAANVTLSQDIFDYDYTTVAISSNNTNDTPSSANYTALTNYLLVNGLSAGEVRTLLVDYEISSTILDDVPGLSNIFIVFIVIIVFMVLGILAGAIYTFGESRWW